MAYDFTFDLTPVSQYLFKEIIVMFDKKEIHRNIEKKVLFLIQKFKIQEITGLPFSEVLMVVGDIVDIYIKNLSMRENFLQTKRRALLLPHCARKYMNNRCKANFDPKISSYYCNHCSSDCLINQATTLAQNKGYDVYVLPGGSSIRKIIKMDVYEGIIGVACCDEIKSGGDYLKRIGIPYQAVPLTKNGCSNTKFSLEVLEGIL